jgi:hypothetical protein
MARKRPRGPRDLRLTFDNDSCTQMVVAVGKWLTLGCNVAMWEDCSTIYNGLLTICVQGYLRNGGWWMQVF